ncbi:anti-FecI sigma factor, FecR [gut metagenome]|uniref:Anti-FecI sigma factor, FecR n=1 Tax=gut metagenome TaxID=749906 RepID=J9BW41_9ZZZZ
MDEAFLLAYLQGQLSENEEEEVERWAALSEENRHQLHQIYYTLHLADACQAYEEADVEAALSKFRSAVASHSEESVKKVPLQPERRSWWKQYGGVAAAFLSGLILASGILLGMLGSSSVYEVSTLPEQRARVILPDGTAVWLNSSTELKYKGGGLLGQREAYLKGEAYFEVKKHAFRSFVVHTRGARTKVLGTKFNVRARKNEKQVVTTLFQGSVQMYHNPTDRQGTRLSPGQTLCLDVESGRSGVYAFNRPEQVLLWIKGELRFTDEPLSQIMDCLSKVHNVKISFADTSLKNQRFTCLFKTDYPLEEVLNTLSLTHHFAYEWRDGEIIIRPFA